MAQTLEAAPLRCAACGAALAPDAPACAYCGSPVSADPGELSRICPGCCARCPGQSRFCTACGSPFGAADGDAAGKSLPCPACEAAMPERQLGGHPAHECPACNGLWVPGENLEGIVAAALEARRGRAEAGAPAPPPRSRGANPARQGVEYRRCPACTDFMARRNFGRASGVIVDRCRHCGTWLDADELEAIAGFLLSQTFEAR